MICFLGKLIGRNEKSNFQMLLEAISKNRIAVQIDPEVYTVVGLLERCVLKKDLKNIFSEEIIDKIEKLIEYLSSLPPEFNCKIELSSESKEYLILTLRKEKIIRSITRELEGYIHAVSSLVDAIWHLFLKEIIDRNTLNHKITKPNTLIERTRFHEKIAFLIKSIKMHLSVSKEVIGIYTSDTFSDLAFSYILETISNILKGICQISVKLFEEKVMLFENDVRIYAGRLYVGENERVNNAAQQYRNIVNNIKNVCDKSNDKMLDKIYVVVEKTKKTTLSSAS